MPPTISHMRRETLESGTAVARCLDQHDALTRIAERIRQLDPTLVMVCARGSSSHAGTFLRYLLARDLGVVASAAMPSIASVYGRRQRLRGALFIAISQSGRSPDIIRQTEEARAAGALSLAIVNDAASPLAAACELVIDIAAGPEQAVAATKTVLASLAAGLALAAWWSGDPALHSALGRLPERLDRACRLDWSALTAALRDVDRIFTVGRGPGLAIASEAALKLAETAAIAGLAYSSAELSHGPMTLAGPHFPVLAFVQPDAARAGTQHLLVSLAAQGVPVFATGGSATGVSTLPTLADDHADVDLLTQLVSFYLAAEAAAQARGRDPDHPPGLHKITRTM